MVEPLKLTLKLAGIIGGVFFAGLFGLTFGLPDSVEKSGQGFIKYQVEMEVREKYADIANSTYGTNAISFLLVAVVAFVKPRAAVQLHLPAAVLIFSTLVCAAIYLFGQNWLFTIIYNDYVGFSYVVYVGVLFAFLCDIAFNKARVTTEILNWIFQTVGSAAQAVSC